MVSPHITAAAAEAAVTSLCEENSCPREIFDGEDDCVTNGLLSPTADCEAKRLILPLKLFCSCCSSSTVSKSTSVLFISESLKIQR